MTPRQLTADNSPKGKGYVVPADIDNPQSDVERDTKKIPLDALMFNGDPVVITADNGDRVLLKAFYIGVANGQKMYKLQMLQQDE